MIYEYYDINMEGLERYHYICIGIITIYACLR